MNEEVSGVGADGPLLDKAGAAALLNVSVRTVEAWIAQRRIPFVKLGAGPRAAVRFRARALYEWIVLQEVKAEEVKAEEVKAEEVKAEVKGDTHE